MTTDPSAIRAEHLRTLRAIHKAAKAELCGCGTPRAKCADHRDQSEQEEQA